MARTRKQRRAAESAARRLPPETTPTESHTLAPIVELAHVRDESLRLLQQAQTQRRGPPLGQQTPALSLYQYDRLGYTELRFSEVIAIIEEAERGNPKRWADLTRRMVKTDPDLLSVVDTRLDGVASVPWALDQPQGVGEADAELAELAVELCTALLAGLPDFEQTQRKLLDGIGQSYAVAEIIWGRVPVALRNRRYLVWGPIDIIPIHPRRFAFTETFELALLEEYRDRTLEGERVRTLAGTGIRLLADKYIVHQPSNVLDYPTSTGLFAAVARYWWVKQWCVRYWLGGSEKAANPRWIGLYPQTATDAAKEQLFEALEGLAADGVGVMSKDNEIELHGGSFEGAARVWRELVDLCDRGFAKAWLGSTLNVDVGDSGSRALGESQATTTIDPRARRDSRSLWCDLRRYLLEPICRYNALYDPTGPFGGRMPPVPTGHHVFAEDPIEVDALLVNSGGSTVDELRQSRGLESWGDARGGAIARPLTSGEPVSALPSTTTAPAASAASAEAVQDTAFNGAQTTALLEIGKLVKSGEITIEYAVFAITSSFPTISPEQARAALASTTPTPSVAPVAPPVPEVAAAADPFALAARIARGLQTATVTSSLSPTSGSRSEPSR